MLTNRKDLLNRLLSVAPGVSKKEIIQQSSCVVFRRGRFYTLSQEIGCSVASNLDPEWNGAIKAEKLIDLLKALPDDELDVDFSAKTLKLKGSGRTIKMTTEEQIVLPVDEVEFPKKDSWVELHEDFSEAIDLVHRVCLKKDNGDMTEFAKRCVHLSPTHLEACDNTKMIRYVLPVGIVKDSILVRGETIKEMADLGMTKGSETENWLHFRNPMGLRMSVRKFALEQYPELDLFLNLRGQKVTFPKGLKDVALRAGIFAAQSADGTDSIRVRVTDATLFVESQNFDGEYRERCKLKHDGPDLSFSIPPKLLAELIDKHTECEVTESTLRVNGGKFTYVSSLESEK